MEGGKCFVVFFSGRLRHRLPAMNQAEMEQESGAVVVAGLTPMQQDFALRVGRDGLSLTQAAEGAGYSTPSSAGSHLMRLPHVRHAVLAARTAALEGDLATLGLRTIRALMTDDMTPAPVRFQAAKWSLETAGHSAAARDQGLPAAEKSLHEMSLPELESFITRGEAALSRLKVVGAPSVEVEAVAVDDSARHSAGIAPPA